VSIKVHNITKIYQGRIFNVVVEKVTLPNGAVKDREIVRHPGAAAMVPMLDDGQIVLIKQYRHAVGGYLWEIPAGTLEPGEPPLKCAHRELIEETGYEPSRLEKLTEMLPAPGYTDEHIHIFLATGLRPVSQKLDDDEVLRVQPTALNSALEMVMTGKIRDGKTIAGILLVSLKRHES